MSNIKKCENTFCKEFTKKMIKTTKDVLKKVIDNKKKNLKDSKSKKDIKELKDLKNKEKIFKNKTFSKTFNKTMTEKFNKACKNAYCNLECKGTVFQNNGFPKELENEFSNKNHGKITIEFLKKMRKEIFKDKKTVLKNSFYTGLNKEDVTKLKKKGAISGCGLLSPLI
jgi:hypothetical protein